MSKKENTLDLAKLVDKGVRVKLAGAEKVSHCYHTDLQSPLNR